VCNGPGRVSDGVSGQSFLPACRPIPVVGLVNVLYVRSLVGTWKGSKNKDVHYYIEPGYVLILGAASLLLCLASDYLNLLFILPSTTSSSISSTHVRYVDFVSFSFSFSYLFLFIASRPRLSSSLTIPYSVLRHRFCWLFFTIQYITTHTITVHSFRTPGSLYRSHFSRL